MRVFLAIAILVLGFMIFEIGRDLWQAHTELHSAVKEIQDLHQETTKGVKEISDKEKIIHEKIRNLEAKIKARSSIRPRQVPSHADRPESLTGQGVKAPHVEPLPWP
jgi:phage host-nuclease inhibitor protein Gam